AGGARPARVRPQSRPRGPPARRGPGPAASAAPSGARLPPARDGWGERAGRGSPRGSSPGPEGVREAPQQDLADDRFGDVVDGTEPKGFGLGGAPGAAGEEDHRSLEAFVADDLEQLEAVE